MYKFRHIHYSLGDSGMSRAMQLYHQQIQSLFDDLIHQPWGLGRWEPPLDILESEDAYYIIVDLPGVDKDQVNVTVEDDILTIYGTKLTHGPTAAAVQHVSERDSGDFLRTIQFQYQIEPDSIQTQLKNGVFTITVTKNGG